MATAKGASKEAIKNRAMQVLKRKKMYEQQRDQLAQQQFNMDQTSFTIESLKDTQETVKTMKEAAKSLKTEYKKINVSKVEDLQDDLADLMEDAAEIQEVMGRSYGVPDGVDEADLDAELAALDDEFEVETAEAPSYLQDTEIPSAPNGAISSGAESVAAPSPAKHATAL